MTEVLVHVVVTARGGDPVTDLEQGDFIVHLDGERVEITGFQRTLLREHPTNGAAGAVVAEAATGPPVNVIVYFDEAGTRFFDRRRFLHRVQREAEALRAWNARFALVTSGDHVQNPGAPDGRSGRRTGRGRGVAQAPVAVHSDRAAL